jgi:hypothetical protein
MRKEQWQFISSITQGIVAMGLILMYFGIIPSRIILVHNSVWWLIAGIVLLVSAFTFSPYGIFRQKVRVDLIPSTGPSLDLFLAVKNNGSTKDFYTQSTLLGPEPNGTVDLKWENSVTRSIHRESGASANLLIASAEPDDAHRLCTMRLWKLSDGEKESFRQVRWNTEPSARLPEYTLQITVLSNMAKPFSELFTVRPRAWDGPLEMFRTRPPFSS